MSERYTKLFSLPENLYTESSPVVIAAGALLKDNATGKVLAQLKLRNITARSIKALRISVTPLDTTGAPLGDAVSHQYLDLSAGRNDEFGQKTPVALSNAATRAFSAAVTEVIYYDNTLWNGTSAPWETLPAPAALDSVLRDCELEKQYRLKFGNDCRHSPMEHKDLWYCACGALNTKEDSNCHKCRNSRDDFFSLDMDALKAAKDERLTAEAKKAAAEKAAAEAQAKKAKKLAAIIVPIVVVVIAAAVFVTQVILPGIRYKSAEALLDAGEYAAAIKAFDALGDYKDSDARAEEAETAQEEAENAAAYEEAVALLEAEDYAAAIEAFEALNGYKDSHNLLLEAEAADAYENALNALENKEYEKAYRLFYSLGEYEDAQDFLNDFVVRLSREDDNYRYVDFYYDAGLLIEEVSTGKSDPIQDSTTVYAYDVDGNLIEEVYTFHSRIDDELYTHILTTTYNPDHTVVHEEGGLYSIVNRDTYYTYDEYGNVLSEEIVNDSQRNYYTYSHTYADDGRLLRTRKVLGSDDSVVEYIYEYDEDGKLSSCLCTNDLPNHHSEAYTEYSYDETGVLIAEKTGDFEISYTHDFLYLPD